MSRPTEPLPQATVVVDLALPDALRKTITTSNALIVVGLTHRRASGKDYGPSSGNLAPLRLYSGVTGLDVLGAEWRNRKSAE